MASAKIVRIQLLTTFNCNTMLINSTRTPAVAGRFYPAGKDSLIDTIETIYLKEKGKIDYTYANKGIIGSVVPHAGYIFSAYQALHFFALLKEMKENIETFIIINPNHTGFGENISLDSHEYWETPLGKIKQDEEFINNLELPFSDIAHQNEHSGEVMLPLLQTFAKDSFKIVVITLSQQNQNNAKLLADKIDQAVKKLNRKILIIASSDFTHFKTPEVSKTLDDKVLAEIENQNTRGVEEVVIENNISVCGYGPIMCLMEYAALQGQYRTEIIARGHSGLIHPSDNVVNYISILFHSS